MLSTLACLEREASWTLTLSSSALSAQLSGAPLYALALSIITVALFCAGTLMIVHVAKGKPIDEDFFRTKIAGVSRR